MSKKNLSFYNSGFYYEGGYENVERKWLEKIFRNQTYLERQM